MSLTNIERLNLAKKRIAEINKKRAENLARYEMEKQAYNKLVAQVVELGIPDINQLPKVVAETEVTFLESLTTLEERITTAESLLSGQTTA